MNVSLSLIYCILWLVIVANGDWKSFDCGMRQLALDYGYNINPNLSTNQLQQIANALNGGPLADKCNVSVSNITKSTSPSKQKIEQLHKQFTTIPAIYVDAINGDDNNYLTNPSSIGKPFKSIQTAIQYARFKYGKSTLKQIVMREGKYYLPNTIQLTPDDSNLIFTNYKDEVVNISGSVPIVTGNTNNVCDWNLYQRQQNNLGIFTCHVNNTNITNNDILGLRIDGHRAIRARYPNANPEIDGFGSNLTSSHWLPNTESREAKIWYEPDYPYRGGSNPQNNEHYRLGIDSYYCRDHFTPPASWFCNVYSHPKGLLYNASIFPHAPYANTSSAVLHAWHGFHWSSWMFQIGDNIIDNETFVFSKGGFQGSRGGDKGGEFYIEGVLEELDAPNEWFYNISQQLLYYYTNRTGHPTDHGQLFEATHLKILFELRGNQSHPVENITFAGLHFTDTVYSYLDPHGVPSGGDWALQYSGALKLVGCKNILIAENVFSRLDGNAIFLFDYNRNITITYNTFEWIGDSCIASWGNTDGIIFEGYSDQDVAQKGADGTNGQQPRHNEISYNFAHDLGIWEKQSSFYFQSVSCCNDVFNNIVFNIPRAAILFNDGFGGNNTVYKNLLFNTCKESSDHGPFNSWDRQPYSTKVADGVTPSTVAGYNEIYLNFMVSNYGATYQVDNDDGSLWYNVHDNLLVYGETAFKSNIGGHDIHHWNNIYAYVNQFCINFFNTDPVEQHKNTMINNTCIVNGTAPNGHNEIYNYGAFYNCSHYGVYAVNNTIAMNNANMDNIGWCNVTQRVLQSQGYNIGGVVQGWMNDKTVLGMARQLLQFQ
eukprot:238584_1